MIHRCVLAVVLPSICIRNPFVWLLLFVLLAGGGCSSPFDADRNGVRRLGPVASRPAWSLDGRTIYYTSRPGSGITEVTLNALDVSSGRTRTLTAVSALNHAEQVRTTSDPTVVHVSMAQPNWSLQLNLYRVSTVGGVIDTIATDVGTPWFVTSRDGSRVAYQGSRYDADTIHVVTTSAQSTTEAIRFPSIGIRPRVISLSPSGEFLIYNSTAGTYLTRTDGSDSRQVTVDVTPILPDVMTAQVRWSADEPVLLIADTLSATPNTVSLQELNATSGQKAIRATLPRFVGQVAWWQLAQTEDGRAFAAWVPVAVLGRNMERTIYRFRLYVKRPANPAPTASLELTGDEPLTWFAFSPNGQLLALLLGSSLYVVDVG